MSTSGEIGDLEIRLSGIGIRPRELSGYETALRHRSTGHKLSNERLEFLGDSVLATAVSAYLMDRYPGCDEGFLTKMRTKLVRGTTLAAIARRIGLADMLEVSEEAAAAGRNEKGDALEDALEALIGATFVDRGFDHAAKWVQSLYERYFDFSEAVQQEVTDKERLLRLARGRGDELTFDVCRVIEGYKTVIKRMCSTTATDGLSIGVGDGPNKKDSLARACHRALRWYSAC
nr:ribonuclease-3 [Oceanusvirus sp.]